MDSDQLFGFELIRKSKQKVKMSKTKKTVRWETYQNYYLKQFNEFFDIFTFTTVGAINGLISF